MSDIVLSSTNVEKMFDYFDEEVELDATTVNGWVVLQLDKLPKAGDTFEYEVGNKLFEGRVIKADDLKKSRRTERGINTDYGTDGKDLW